MKNKINGFDFSWLESAPLRTLFEALEEKGAIVLVVGGCVRNTVLGLPVGNDVDIATDATPAEVIELAKKANLKVIPTGIIYGTVTIIIDYKEFQVTTFRSDILTDGRYAKVDFSKNIEDDASRRDFTMNAIYMTRGGELLDPINGLNDLIKREVRFIGDPLIRIKEDYLRILRYFRFCAIYSGNKLLDNSATLLACSKALTGLKKISKQRIWSELKKLLGAKYPVESLRDMEKCGVLQELLPGADVNRLHLSLKYEKFMKFQPYFLNRFASLNRNRVECWVKKIPLSKIEKKYIDGILKIIGDNSSLTVKAYKYGKKGVLKSLIISQEIEFDAMDNYWMSNLDKAETKVFPLSTRDFLKYNSPSARLGKEIRRVKNEWYNSNFELERAELLKHLKGSGKV